MNQGSSRKIALDGALCAATAHSGDELRRLRRSGLLEESAGIEHVWIDPRLDRPQRQRRHRRPARQGAHRRHVACGPRRRRSDHDHRNRTAEFIKANGWPCGAHPWSVTTACTRGPGPTGRWSPSIQSTGSLCRLAKTSTGSLWSSISGEGADGTRTTHLEVGQLAQMPRRHELRQRVEVVARHRAVFVGSGVRRLIGIEQVLLCGDQQPVRFLQRHNLRA